ncbi:MAG: cytochrome c [Bacteroidia bacterium]|nr:cytochrome c [Bacteroidia bacterium]
MKQLIFFTLLALFIVACGGSGNDQNANVPPPKSMIPDPPKDDGKGIGEFKNVTLNDPLNADMAKNGKAIFDLKCAACHRLSDKRIVGPGFKGITDRRKPEWIMNMVTNVETMLDQDPAAQKLLEECLTRMPNQNVSANDARDILEFLYQNDVES